MIQLNIRKIANPLEIKFREKDHKYFSDINTNHVSVTTKLKEYQTEFPEDAVRKYVKKHTSYYPPKNYTVEYITSCWNEQERLGLEIGSWLHIQLENQLNNKIPDLDYLLTKEDSIEKDLIKRRYLDNYKIQIAKYLKEVSTWNYLGSEIIVGNKTNAGQIDTLFSTHIDDFKNDKEIEFSNRWAKMKPPFDDLDDCNWNKYCLQINFYHYLLPDKIKAEFTRPHRIVKFDRYSTDYKIYDVPDWQHRIKQIMI